MSNLPADFDAEKRRRWYAVCLGGASASALIGILVVRFTLEGVLEETGGPLWQIALGIFGFWLFFFIFKFATAYALWYRPYASRIRAISLSVGAIFVTYICLFGSGASIFAVQGGSINFKTSLQEIWAFHAMIYGLPYVAAAIVGWGFARPAPDVREYF